MKIGTVKELEKFTELVNGGETKLNAVLTADLDLSGKYGNGTEGWQGFLATIEFSMGTAMRSTALLWVSRTVTILASL